MADRVSGGNPVDGLLDDEVAEILALYDQCGEDRRVAAGVMSHMDSEAPLQPRRGGKDQGWLAGRPHAAVGDGPVQWRISWPVVGRLSAAYVAARVSTVLPVATALWMRDPSRQLLDVLVRWDGEWYLNIAEHGYPPLDPYLATDVPGDLSGNGAFFPLYPMLIRVASQVGDLTPSFAALLLSFAGGLAATLLCYVLMRHIAGDGAATRAAVLFAFFPGSFVFSMAYAEAITIAVAMACLLALLERRWLLAGVMTALATATRPNAIALVIPCAWAAVVHLRRTGQVSALAAPLLAPVGFLGHLAFLWWRTGEPLAWFIIQREGWGTKFGVGKPLSVELSMAGWRPIRGVKGRRA